MSSTRKSGMRKSMKQQKKQQQKKQQQRRQQQKKQQRKSMKKGGLRRRRNTMRGGATYKNGENGKVEITLEGEETLDGNSQIVIVTPGSSDKEYKAVVVKKEGEAVEELGADGGEQPTTMM